MQITRGKLQCAQKVVIYGPEGIGKSTFAAQFPEPVFIDTEGSTKHMDVARLPKPTSWTMLLEEVKAVKDRSVPCRTLVLDTADWAERLCCDHVCAKARKAGIEDFSYGKGYVYVGEEFGRLLNLLEEAVDRGVNVVVTAHAWMRKFEQPDEMGAYDRWEMKLSKKVEPLVKEWADMVLFANYKTFTVKSESNKTKAQGGTRVLYTAHHPCWDAKNRHGLAPELPLDYREIACCIGGDIAPESTPVTLPEQQTEPCGAVMDAAPGNAPSAAPPEPTLGPPADSHDRVSLEIPAALADLMRPEQVTAEEIQAVVANRGYYPANMPVSGYDAGFIEGVLIGAWPQVFEMVRQMRENSRDDLPF